MTATVISLMASKRKSFKFQSFHPSKDAKKLGSDIFTRSFLENFRLANFAIFEDKADVMQGWASGPGRPLARTCTRTRAMSRDNHLEEELR